MNNIEALENRINEIEIPYGEKLQSRHLIQIQFILRDIVSEVKDIKEKIESAVTCP